MNAKKILRNTCQRQAILDELQKQTSHPTAQTIYNLVKEKMPYISLGTVYRNLDILSDAGQIIVLDINDSKKRYDANIHPHDHMFCYACEQIIDIFIDSKSALTPIMEKSKGHCLQDYTIMFRGICEQCQKNTSH